MSLQDLIRETTKALDRAGVLVKEQTQGSRVAVDTQKLQGLSRRQRLKILKTVYAYLPKIDCQQKCQAWCGPIMMSDLEAKRMRVQSGQDNLLPTDSDGTCPMLVDGLCSVYSVRPLICRLWGVTPAMTCPFGCKAEWELEDDSALIDLIFNVCGDVEFSEMGYTFAEKWAEIDHRRVVKQMQSLGKSTDRLRESRRVVRELLEKYR